MKGIISEQKEKKEKEEDPVSKFMDLEPAESKGSKEKSDNEPASDAEMSESGSEREDESERDQSSDEAEDFKGQSILKLVKTIVCLSM